VKKWLQDVQAESRVPVSAMTVADTLLDFLPYQAARHELLALKT
jgi:hypothetical protein